MKSLLDTSRLEALLTCAEARETPELPASYLRDHVVFPSLRGEPVSLYDIDFTAFDEQSLEDMLADCAALRTFFRRIGCIEERCADLDARSSGVKFF